MRLADRDAEMTRSNNEKARVCHQIRHQINAEWRSIFGRIQRDRPKNKRLKQASAFL